MEDNQEEEVLSWLVKLRKGEIGWRDIPEDILMIIFDLSDENYREVIRAHFPNY